MAVITQPPLDDGDQAHMSVARSHPLPVMHRHTSMGTGATDHWGETLAGESERRGGPQSQATCPLQLLCPVSWGDK